MVEIKYDKAVKSKQLLVAMLLLEKHTGVRWGHYTPKKETYFITSAEFPIRVGVLRVGSRQLVAPGIKFDLILRTFSNDANLHLNISRELCKGLKTKLPEAILLKFDRGDITADPMAESVTEWAAECPIVL